MIKTEAWVLHEGPRNGNSGKVEAGELKREEYSFPDLKEHEVLVEPLYGCWEGNMSHAVQRSPIDICRQRGEEKVVIGNAGVVRVLQIGESVNNVKEGDCCLVFCNGEWDELGYAKTIYAYDSPATVGLLAKRTKLHEKQLIHIPANTRHSLQQWAAFSLRYITAWANWKVAYGMWKLQMTGEDCPPPHVWGWGGGVSLAEVTLAKLAGCQAAMISAGDKRLDLIQQMGIMPIDRRNFGGLDFEEAKYKSDKSFRGAYQESEKVFLNIVNEHTSGSGVSIFIDFIGLPVFRATLKALSRPGIITTAGWKEGMNLSTLRAIECMNWHTHIHTHYARYHDGLEAVEFAEQNGWAPALDGEDYGWNDIPRLAQEHIDGAISTYFPIYQVNPV